MVNRIELFSIVIISISIMSFLSFINYVEIKKTEECLLEIKNKRHQLERVYKHIEAVKTTDSVTVQKIDSLAKEYLYKYE